MGNSRNKYDLLTNNIKKLGSLAVAFSGGVDSTFLLKAAKDAIPDGVIAVTVNSPLFPEREAKQAEDLVKWLGVRHIVAVDENLDRDYFIDNPADRCYYCKKNIFLKIIEIARSNNSCFVADGSNIDDLDDYRPGMKAIKELGVISPLKDAKMSKDEIRLLSKELGLPTWNKPSYACLASRIPYGVIIDREKLSMIDRAEQYLSNLGFSQLRVRHHGDVARIEVPSGERQRFFDIGLMDRVCEEFRSIGFRYTALDLKGYTMGSLNEAIGKKTGI